MAGERADPVCNALRFEPVRGGLKADCSRAASHALPNKNFWEADLLERHAKCLKCLVPQERFGTKVQAKLLITLNRPRLTMASGYVSVYRVDRRRSIFV